MSAGDHYPPHTSWKFLDFPQTEGTYGGPANVFIRVPESEPEWLPPGSQASWRRGIWA